MLSSRPELTLPNEVLLSVVSYIQDVDTLKSLSLMNPAMRSFAQSCLFSKPSLSRSSEHSTGLAKVLCLPHISPFIRDIRISTWGMMPARFIQLLEGERDLLPVPEGDAATGRLTGHPGSWASALSALVDDVFTACSASIKSLRFEVGMGSHYYASPQWTICEELNEEFAVCMMLRSLSVYDFPKLRGLCLMGKSPVQLLHIFKPEWIDPRRVHADKIAETASRVLDSPQPPQDPRDSKLVRSEGKWGPSLASFMVHPRWWAAPPVPVSNDMLLTNLTRVGSIEIIVAELEHVPIVGYTDWIAARDEEQVYIRNSTFDFLKTVAPDRFALDYHGNYVHLYPYARDGLLRALSELELSYMLVLDSLSSLIKSLRCLRRLDVSVVAVGDRYGLHANNNTGDSLAEVFDACAGLPLLKYARFKNLRPLKLRETCFDGDHCFDDEPLHVEGDDGGPMVFERPIQKAVNKQRIEEAGCSKNWEDIEAFTRLYRVIKERSDENWEAINKRKWAFCFHPKTFYD